MTGVRRHSPLLRPRTASTREPHTLKPRRVSQVTVRLNPDPIWGQRTQNYSIEGRDQAGGAFNTLVGSGSRVFTPGTAPGDTNANGSGEPEVVDAEFEEVDKRDRKAS